MNNEKESTQQTHERKQQEANDAETDAIARRQAEDGQITI